MSSFGGYITLFLHISFHIGFKLPREMKKVSMNVYKLLSKLKNSFDHAYLACYERVVPLILIDLIGKVIALEVRIKPGSYFSFFCHKTGIKASF